MRSGVASEDVPRPMSQCVHSGVPLHVLLAKWHFVVIAPLVHLLHSLLLYGWTAIDPASLSSCRAFGQTVSGNMVGGMAEASTGAAETQSRAPQPARAEGGFLNTAEGPGPPGGGTA